MNKNEINNKDDIEKSISTVTKVVIKEVCEESLNSAIGLIKNQQKNYKSAGLTQVSHWL